MDDPISDHLQDMQELAFQLLALDQLLGSVPLESQQDLDLDAILPGDIISKAGLSAENIGPFNTTPSWDVDELYKVVDTVPRFTQIPATLVDICKIS